MASPEPSVPIGIDLDPQAAISLKGGYPAHLLPPTHHTVHIRGKRAAALVSISVLVGLAASCVALILRYLIHFITNVCFFGEFSVRELSPADNHLGGWVVLLPIAGGLIAGLMARYCASEIRGHGIPEAMQSILHNESRIKPSLVVLKPLSSAIVIGTGSPFGTEGPIVATGAALGSLAGQILPTTSSERKTLLTVGAAAGMSGIFGTPLAAILISIELLLYEYNPLSIICVGLGCFFSDYIREIVLNGKPFFPVPDVAPTTLKAMLVYVVVGIVAGLAGSYISKLLYFMEDLYEKTRIHWMWWPAIGAVAVGVIGYFVPRTLGVGYENITDISSDSFSLDFLVLLVITKFISWIIALSSGTSGGTLAPMFTIGCGIGAILATGFRAAAPGAGINITIAALVGMASIFVAASRAILMSIVFAIEVTRQINALPPIIGGCTVALLISWLVMPHSIMTEKIARRGRSVVQQYAADFRDTASVRELMNKRFKIVKQNASMNNFQEMLQSEEGAKIDALVVVDGDNNLVSLLSRSDVLAQGNNNNNNGGAEAIGDNLNAPCAMVSINNSLRQAMDHMIANDATLVVVLDRDEVVGVLSLDACNTHQKQYLKQRASKSKMDIRMPRMDMMSLSGLLMK